MASNLTGEQFMQAMNFKQKKLRASDGVSYGFIFLISFLVSV